MYYNDDPATPLQRGFISDRVNRLMGFAVLRQVRVKPSKMVAIPAITFQLLHKIIIDSCTIYDRMASMSKQCHAFSSIVNEDRSNYGPGWDKTKVDEDRPEYQYKSPMDLNTLPTTGTLDVYR